MARLVPGDRRNSRPGRHRLLQRARPIALVLVLLAAAPPPNQTSAVAALAASIAPPALTVAVVPIIRAAAEAAIRAPAQPTQDTRTEPADALVRRSGTHLELDGATYLFRGLNLYNINGDGDCGYAIADLGTELDRIGASANVVRGWFFQYLATDHSTGARDWSKFDATLATLRAHHVRVIATLADEWGACEAAAPRGPLQIGWYAGGYRRTPYSTDVRASYRDWVAEVVTRYRDDPTILAWQLMNEATAVSDAAGSCPDQGRAAAALQAWATDMARVVKAHDANHLLSIGTVGSTQCGTTGRRYADLYATPGVDLCESHDYTAPTATLPEGVTWEIEACRALGKPIFVGEMGIPGSAVAGDLSRRARLFWAKAVAALGAGMTGVIAWAWRSEGDGGSSHRGFDIGPGDPLLAALAALPTVAAASDLGRHSHRVETPAE